MRSAKAHLHGAVLEARAVFLLTDKRTTRWLPTLLAVAHACLALTAQASVTCPGLPPDDCDNLRHPP